MAEGQPSCVRRMFFDSILFAGSDDGRAGETHEVPEFFGDLNLDQIIDAVTADWKDYDLAPFYYTRPKDLDAILYRQEVMQDLENPVVMEAIKSFSRKLRTMRERLAQAAKFHDYRYASERCFLSAAEVYCEAVESLAGDLSEQTLGGRAKTRSIL